jgi:hypothetical protein
MALFGLSNACVDNLEETPPPPEPSITRVECEIDGREWKANSVTLTDLGISLQLAGIRGAESVQIVITDATLEPGDYPIGSTEEISMSYLGNADVYGESEGGTMELLVNNDQVIAGRFEVRLKSMISESSVNITEGKFLYERQP